MKKQNKTLECYNRLFNRFFGEIKRLRLWLTKVFKNRLKIENNLKIEPYAREFILIANRIILTVCVD